MVVRANWGAPVEFSTAKVVSNSKVAQQLHKVVVDVGDLAAGYAKGGQFMQIKVGPCQESLQRGRGERLFSTSKGGGVPVAEVAASLRLRSTTP